MTEDVTLLTTNKDCQAPSYQRTKYLLLVTLQVLKIEGKAPEMTAKQLYEWVPLSLNAVSSCLYRMSAGYTRPGLPHFKRNYVRRIPTLRSGSLYKLLQKGDDFVFRMNKTRPDDTAAWINELLNYREMKRNIRQMMSKYKTEDSQE
jgi:hypothetical protein